jgi:(2Fe-2S) ferredoxin
MESPAWRFIVCINKRPSLSQPSCGRMGGESLAQALENEIAKRGLSLYVERIRCLGECAQGPNLRLAPGGKFFYGVKLDDIQGIVDESLEAMATCDQDHSEETGDEGI